MEVAVEEAEDEDDKPAEISRAFVTVLPPTHLTHRKHRVVL